MFDELNEIYVSKRPSRSPHLRLFGLNFVNTVEIGKMSSILFNFTTWYVKIAKLMAFNRQLTPPNIQPRTMDIKWRGIG